MTADTVTLRPGVSARGRPPHHLDRSVRAVSGELPLSLDTVSAHWRTVFDTTQDALSAASECGTLGLADQELRERAGRLATERESTAQLLDELAHEERILLRHRLSAPRPTGTMLGLPVGIRACVFTLDGVLAASAVIHAAAWAETLNEFLLRRVERTGERFAPFRPFNPDTDYLAHIHGKPRLEGVHAFLASRGIGLPEGHADDPPGAETVYGLANRKNEALRQRLEREGVTAFADSRRYLEAAGEAGLACSIVSSSANAATILELAGLDDLVGLRVDGNMVRAERLRSKPAPDMLLAACRHLGVSPHQAAAFETTLAGVMAARAADVGYVIGVERGGRPDTLGGGADIVVADLATLLDPALAA